MEVVWLPSCEAQESEPKDRSRDYKRSCRMDTAAISIYVFRLMQVNMENIPRQVEQGQC